MKKKTPADIFIAKDRLAFVWFILFIATLLIAWWDRTTLLERLTTKPQFFVVDSNSTYYLPAAMDFENATEVHADQTAIAMEAVFNRNPGGYDNPKKVERIMHEDARKKMQKVLEEERTVFQGQHIHQKIEVGTINILQATEKSVLASASGQIIQNGIFQGEAFTRVYEVQARFVFAFNKGMETNGQLPTVCVELDYKLKKVIDNS